MPKPFDPIRILKDLSNDLLRELFRREGAKLRIPWNALSERDISPIVLLWETMPSVQRQHIHLILQDVHSLTFEGGLRALAEQVEQQHPELLPEFSQQRGWHDRVLWCFLYAADAFESAAVFACADKLTRRRYWNRWDGLPTQQIDVAENHIAALQNELRKYYWPRELRGRHCRVQHHRRGNGVDYFFAYLDDWPDKLLTFDEEGHMESRSSRYAFTNVFAFDWTTGCLDLVAKGGRKVHQHLCQAFCRSVLETEVANAQPVRPAYTLDHLLNPYLALPTHPGDQVSSVRLTRIRYAPKDVVTDERYSEIAFSQSATLERAMNRLRERLADDGTEPDHLTVKQAAFQLQFAGEGRARPRTLTFNIGSPNSCDLKSKSDDLREIGERCLRLWGICRD